MEPVEPCNEEEELRVLLWAVFVLFHVGTVDDAVFFTSVKRLIVKLLCFFAFDFFAANLVKLSAFFDDELHVVVVSFVDFSNRTI